MRTAIINQTLFPTLALCNHKHWMNGHCSVINCWNDNRECMKHGGYGGFNLFIMDRWKGSALCSMTLKA